MGSGPCRAPPRPGGDVDAPVRFLPEFDNLLLSHADRTRIVSEPHRKAMATKNLFQPATVLVDGRVAGTWMLVRTRSEARVVIVPFVSLTRPDRAALEREGVDLVRFAEPDAASHVVEVAKKRRDE